MLKVTFVAAADHNSTVEQLKHRNAQIGGKNYLDLDTGHIVRIEEEKEESKYVPLDLEPTEALKSKTKKK